MSYTTRAKEALDELGWADTSDPMEVTRATMTLAIGQLPKPCPLHGYVGEPESHVDGSDHG